MAYAIRFKSRARQELDQCCECYGETFRREIWDWLKRIAQAAESANDEVLLDIASVIEEGLRDAGKSWKHAWREWWSASLPDKVRAAYVVFKKWCPPWQMKLAVEWFTVIGRFDCEIHAYVVVDHVEKRIIIAKFDGLPGQ